VGLDITQHATFGRYWGPTSVAYAPAPFIWGPIGGGETAPAAFRADFTRRGQAYEYLRDCARRCGERDPAVRRAAQETALALAVTSETKARLQALGTRDVELFSAMGFSRAQYAALCEVPPAGDDVIRFVSMGRLLQWKGFHLGLKAFAAAAVPQSEYWIVGDGPERANLRQLAEQLGLAQRVRFLGPLSRPEALQTLAACHVLVHPSVHDSGGWVCLEAMAAARPVICVDLGGPAEQVTSASGIKIPAATPTQVVHDLAHAMTAVAGDAGMRDAMGAAGRARVGDEYLWERKGERLDAIFRSVLSRRGVAGRRR
jgi:glycosyltransferase involved in cell wall biosynthesis